MKIQDVQGKHNSKKREVVDPHLLHQVNNARSRDIPVVASEDNTILTEKTKHGILKVKQVVRYGRVYAEVTVV